MADYNLGTAHGRITVDYDGANAGRAIGDFGRIKGAASKLSDEFSLLRRRWTGDSNAMSNDVRKFAASFGIATGALAIFTSSANKANSAALGMRGGMNILRSFGVLMGKLPAGTSGFPDMIKRIIQLSAAITLLRGSSALLAQVASRFALFQRFAPAIKEAGEALNRLGTPIHVIRDMAVSIGFLGIQLRLAARLIKVFAVAGAALGALGGAVQIVAGLVQGIVQLSGAALLVPGALFAVGAAAGVAILGMQGLSAAIKNGGKDLAALPPATKDFATQVRLLAPMFDNMRRFVQDRLFANLGQDVQNLGRIYMPLLKEGLGQVASAMNTVVQSFARFAQAPKTQQDFQAALKLSANVIQNLAGSVEPILNVLRNIGTVGLQAFNDLTGGIGNAAQKLDDFIQKTRDSGQMRKWIDDGVQGFKDLLVATGNLGSMLQTIFKGLAGGDQANFLEMLRNGTQAMKDFFESAKGQSILKTFGTILSDVWKHLQDLGRIIADSVLPVIDRFLPIIQKLGDAIMEGLGRAVDFLAPIFKGLATLLGPIAPLFSAIAGGAVTLLTILAGLGLAAKVAGFAFLFLRSGFDIIRSGANAGRLALGLLTGGFAGFRKASDLAKGSITGFGDATKKAASNFGFQTAATNTAAEAAKKASGVFGTLSAGYSKAAEAVKNFGNSSKGVAAPLSSVGDSVMRNIYMPIQKVPEAAGKATSTLSKFGSVAAGLGGAALSGVKSIGLGLLGALGGPWGAVITGAMAALSLFIGSQQAAEQAAKDHQAAIDNLSGSLEAYTGAVGDAAIKDQAKALSSKLLADGHTTALQALGKYGIAMEDFTKATLNQPEALKKVHEQISNQARGLIENSDAWKKVRDQITGAGLSLDDVTSAALGNTAAMDKIKEHGIDWDVMGERIKEVLGPLGELNGMLGDQASAAQEAANRIQEEALATQAFKNLLPGAITSMKEFGKEHIDAFGNIDQSAAGAKELATQLTSLGQAATGAAQAEGRHVASSKGVAEGAKAAGQYVNDSRQAFIAQATAMGLSLHAAENLADSIGLIPKVTEVNFKTNATAAEADLNHVKFLFDAVPGVKTVTVSTLTEEAQKSLETMGFTVTHLPDGTFTITANTDSAKQKLGEFKDTADSETATITLDANADPATGKTKGAINFGNNAHAEMTLDADSNPASGKIKGTISYGNGQTSRITIDANQTPANGKIKGVITYANGQTAVIDVEAAGVGAAKAAIDSAAANRFATIFVRTQVTGVTGAPGTSLASAARNARGNIYYPGNVLRMAAGGIRGMWPRGVPGIAAPNSMTAVYGDRSDVPESYIPWVKGSKRVLELLETTAKALGYGIMPIKRMAQGGILSHLQAVSRNVPMPMAGGGIVPVRFGTAGPSAVALAGVAGSMVFNGPMHVTIDAASVAEMRDVTDFFRFVGQRARAGKRTA